MDLDDELRKSGDALDSASRRHRRPVDGVVVKGRRATGAPWAAIAATVLVLGVVVTAFVIGGDESDSTTVVDGADTTVDTTNPVPNETVPGGTEVTTPLATDGETTPTEPTQTMLTSPPSSPPANPSGYRCLEDRGGRAVTHGITFEIVRVPTCSATNTVFLRMGGSSSTKCFGPPAARLSVGIPGGGVTTRSQLLFTTAGDVPWSADGRWRPVAPGESVADGATVPYASAPSILRPIELPADATGDVSIEFDLRCAGDVTVHVEFRLVDTPTTIHGVVRVDEDAKYYGACGNETASFSGETWYPLQPQEQDLIDPDLYPAPAPPSSGLRAPKVAPPGPGDDVGTFVVFDDGIGRYESDSGRIVWLTQEPHEYSWVC